MNTSNPVLQNCCQSYLESNLFIPKEIKISWVSIYHQAAIFPLTNGRIKSRMPLLTRIHCLSNENDDISPKDRTKRARRGRWENSNYQFNNFVAYPSFKPSAIILNEVNRYCSTTYRLVMIDMQTSCIVLVYVRMQIVYVMEWNSSTRTELSYDRGQRWSQNCWQRLL